MLFVSTELYLGMLIIIVWNWNDSVKCLTIGCIASVSFLAGTIFFFFVSMPPMYSWGAAGLPSRKNNDISYHEYLVVGSVLTGLGG
jgi:hypothetical protein